MSEQTFHADRNVYIKAHVMLAVIGGIGATLLLFVVGNPHVWTGFVASILAVGARGWFMMSEELGHVWTLTNHDLSGPMQRHTTLSDIARVKILGSAVQVITASGDKHLIKFLANPEDVASRIRTRIGMRDQQT